MILSYSIYPESNLFEKTKHVAKAHVKNLVNWIKDSDIFDMLNPPMNETISDISYKDS